MLALVNIDGVNALEEYAVKLSRGVRAYCDLQSISDKARIRGEARKYRVALKKRWLKALDSEVSLTDDENRQLRQLESSPLPAETNIREAVVVLKATRLCNLRCTYCNSWGEGPGQVMTFDTAAKIIRETLLAPGRSKADFIWHGGEITMLKPKFFRKFIWLQERYRRPGQVVTNSVQTNATNITDEWLGLLCVLNMGVGISVDGPEDLHDSRRKTKKGGPSSHLVTAGVARLKDAGVEHGVLVVVDRDVINRPVGELLGYFTDKALFDIDFLNYVPSNESMSSGETPDEFISFREFCEWMRKVYREWNQHHRSRLRIRFLDDLIDMIVNSTKPKNCYFSGDCLDRIFTAEPSGVFSPCDKFVGGPHSKYGSIRGQPLNTILSARSELKKYSSEIAQTETTEFCPWSGHCRGACPHDRAAARLFDREFSSGCCGLAGLLDDISIIECGADAKTVPPAAELT